MNMIEVNSKRTQAHDTIDEDVVMIMYLVFVLLLMLSSSLLPYMHVPNDLSPYLRVFFVLLLVRHTAAVDRHQQQRDEPDDDRLFRTCFPSAPISHSGAWVRFEQRKGTTKS